MKPVTFSVAHGFSRALLLSLWVIPALFALACQGVEVAGEKEPLEEYAAALVALEPGQVIVSLNFDDNRASQADAGTLLQARGMRGTFYANSGRVGMSGYLTYEQLRQLQAAGHEVAGHTLSHPRLTTLDAATQRREVCDDRAALLNAGLRVTSFAYPFGDADSNTRQLLIECGYNSGRESGGLRTPGSCSSCPYAESVPPRDAYAFRTHGSVQRTWTLSYLQDLVLRAESSGGGWVPLVFHEICPASCPSSETYGIPRSTFIAFLDWLGARTARGTVVRTVDEVIGGPLQPPPGGAPPPPPTELAKNPSLEADSNGDGTPDCWQRGGFGTNSFSWSRTTDAHSGSWAQRLTISSISSGDRKLITLQDSGTCAPALTAGHRYKVSAWYKATASPRLKAYYRDGSGTWNYWAQGPLLSTRGSYGFTEWTTPAAPSGATALSVGLSLDRVGTMTMDDFSLTDIDASTSAPALSEVSP